MSLKVGTNGENKDRFFQSICPMPLSTSAYIDRSAVLSSAASSIQSSTELSRDRFPKCVLSISNTKVFKVLKRLSQPVLIPTLILNKSVIRASLFNDKMATSTSATWSSSIL